MAVKTFDFSELRALLQQEPSAQVWEQVCQLVGSARWDKAAEQWLPYAEGSLERGWPDRLRTWPSAWRVRRVAASVLARHLEVGSTNVKTMNQCIDALEASAPPLTMISVMLGNREPGPLSRLLRAAPATLTRLELTGAVPMEAVFESAPLAQLSALRIEQVPTLDDADLDKLLKMLGEPLRELAVRWGSLTPEGARTLAQSEHVARLVTLDLGGSRIAHEPGDPNVGLRHLASVEWPALERLDLSQQHLDDPAELGRLVARMPLLLDLELAGNVALGGADMTALIKGLRAPLRMLGLRGCQITDASMAELLGMEQLEALEQLDLSETCVGRATGVALRKVGSQLTRLDMTRLDMTQATYQDAMELAQAMAGTTLPALSELGVIPDVDFIRAMARVELPSLRRLVHEGKGEMDEEVMAAVRRAPWGVQLDAMI
jgi:hypothetical protein